MHKILNATIIGFILTLFSATAVHASGSGSGGGGYSGASQPRDPYAEAYSRGKSVISKRIACKKCMYSKGVRDTVTAKEVSRKVQAGEFNLSMSQRDDALFYLSRRFGA
jgi:hypothetical protein